MSLRIDRTSVKRRDGYLEEPALRWDETTDNEEKESISSEDDIGCEVGGDPRVRQRPVLEIWDSESVWNGLQSLPGAEDIIQMITDGRYDRILYNEHATTTGFLIAAWTGNDRLLRLVIDKGASVKYLDNGGRSALHLAACSGNVECVKILIDAGANVGLWDGGRRATPLHCAANKGHLSCLKMLIRYKADVNAGITSRSPLHYAVQSVAPDCVKELLEAGAIPNTPQIFSETPLHVAAAMGSPEILKLLIKYGAAVRVQCGPERTTALHLAAEDGDLECVRILIEAGAQISATNHRMQTPLHMAALSQSPETLELFLGRKANPNVCDTDGRTPLHNAIAKYARSSECVRLLLTAGANPNKADAFGYTPMHLAALNEFSHCVLLLLNYGGDVTARTNGGVSVLTFITRRTPDVIPKYISKFDSSIKVNDHEIGDVDCELKLDFRILVPTIGKGESELLLNFIEVGHREILKHPLCETFLFLKWRRIRKFFLISLFYHTLFVCLFTGYTVGVFLKNCPSTRTVADRCLVNWYAKSAGYCLTCLNFLMMAKEIFQIAHNWFVYIKQWENWLQWLIIISVFLCVYPASLTNIQNAVQTWQHHVAAVGIFLTWVELMVIVGRFPVFGLYIQMFTTVAINFSKFILAYSCLLIAFGLSFGVLFANYPAFQNLIWGQIKTAIMMIGELEFEDIFYGDYPIIYPITAHIMFIVFVLLVTLILSNLMVGLAVSDIQGLQKSARLDRLVRQAELVAHLESMLFSRLLKCIPRKFMAFLYRHALLLKSQYHWALYVRPNDPREERIPKELIKGVYEIVVERKEKPRNKKFKSIRVKSSFHIRGGVMRNPVFSRLNSNESVGTFDDYPKLTSFKNQISDLSRDFQEFSKLFNQRLEQIVPNEYCY